MTRGYLSYNCFNSICAATEAPEGGEPFANGYTAILTADQFNSIALTEWRCRVLRDEFTRLQHLFGLKLKEVQSLLGEGEAAPNHSPGAFSFLAAQFHHQNAREAVCTHTLTTSDAQVNPMFGPMRPVGLLRTLYENIHEINMFEMQSLEKLKVTLLRS